MKRIESIVIDLDDITGEYCVTGIGRASYQTQYVGQDVEEVETTVIYKGKCHFLAIRLVTEICKKVTRQPQIINLLEL